MNQRNDKNFTLQHFYRFKPGSNRTGEMYWWLTRREKISILRQLILTVAKRISV